MTATPSLYAVLEDFAKSREMNIYTALPAKVETYDPSTGLADVAPVVGGLWVDRDGSDPTQVPLPKIAAVPVIHPRGGGMVVSVPLQPGEYVLLVCTTYSFAQWYNDGADFRAQSDPRRHALDQCFAIPGVFNAKIVLPDLHPENLVLGESEGTQIWVQPDNGQILLGGNDALHFVAMANLVLAELQKINTAIASAILTTPVDGTSALTALQTALSGLTFPSSVSATKVKAV